MRPRESDPGHQERRPRPGRGAAAGRRGSRGPRRRPAPSSWRASPMSRSRRRGSRSRQRRARARRGPASRQGAPSQSISRVSTAARTSDDRLAVEQAPAGQHLEQDDAEGPDVGAPVDRLAPRLLGGHVGGRAEDEAGRGAGLGEGRRLRQVGPDWRPSRVAGPGLGETEVEHLDLPVRRHLDVRRLEVAVDDALLVRLLERLGDLLRDGDRLVDAVPVRASAAPRGPRPRPAP